MKDKLIQTFMSVLGLMAAEVEDAAFKVTPQWDSVGHVNLMNQIEEDFDISLEPDDILDFRSFKIGMELLKKYGLES